MMQAAFKAAGFAPPPDAGAVKLSEFWAHPDEEKPRIARMEEALPKYMHLSPFGDAEPVVVVGKSHNDNFVVYFVEEDAVGAPTISARWLCLEEERKAERNKAAAVAGAPLPHASVAAVRFTELELPERGALGARVTRGADGRHHLDLSVGRGLNRTLLLEKDAVGNYAIYTTVGGVPARLETIYTQMRATSIHVPSVEYLNLYGTSELPPHAQVTEKVVIPESTALETLRMVLGY
jgi:hypothetical protein